MEKLRGKFGEIPLNAFHGFFTNKKVFITGHTGFIGSWLTLWLNLLGAKIVGYSLPPPTDPSLFKTINLKEQIVNIEDDVRDYQHLFSSLSKHSPEIVIHLAAQPLVLDGYRNPMDTLETNVMGTVNVLEAIRNLKSVKICVNFTSDKCYENVEKNYAYRETDPMGGYDPYSASKGASEIITSSYKRSFFNSHTNDEKVSISTIRAGNLIGGGDWSPERIIPDSIRSLIGGHKINLRNPEATRPWQHVLEPISGILWLITKMSEKPSYDGPWNIGPNDYSVTVKDLVTQIIAEWGNGFWDCVPNNTNSHESMLLKLDCNKAKSLGWSSVYSTKEAISETISWYRSYYEKKINMIDYTKKQIENYFDKAKDMNMPWTK